MRRGPGGLAALALTLAMCGASTHDDTAASMRRVVDGPKGAPPSTATAAPKPAPVDKQAAAREHMVRTQLASRDIKRREVLDAMRTVPRHEFVPDDVKRWAYGDHPLPIGHDVTISQPYIVALMTELSGIKKGDTVLEVGTGSGYQAAVLAQMGASVYTIEIIDPLAKKAKKTLGRLGYDKVHVKSGDGYGGWPDKGPFDAVIITAAPPKIPAPLKRQLKVGGRLVAPVGRGYQELIVLTRTRTSFSRRSVIPVRFVPMTGKAQQH